MSTLKRGGSHSGLGAGLLFLGLLVLPLTAAGQPFDDVFTTTVFGSTVTVNHLNAYYNCVQDSIICLTEWSGADLVATEYELPPGGLADCICYFDLRYELTDLPAGPLTILWNYLESGTGGWTEVVLEVVVGDDGQSGLGGDVLVEQSECHNGHVVGEAMATWGAIKRRFR